MAAEKSNGKTDTVKTPLHMAMQEVSDLNEKGIKVQGGKKYTQVVTRVEVFRKHFGLQYGIETGIFEFAGGFMAKALIRDLGTDKIIGTGHSFANNIAKEKSVEKFETTAIGRALASCGLAGGEYATQDEIETHEERYERKPEFTREDKMFQRDFLYDLASTDDVDSLIAKHEERFTELPEYINGLLTDAVTSRKIQIQNKISTVPPKYGFIDVDEANGFLGYTENLIEKAKDISKLGQWMVENDHKLKALDMSLKAAKYQLEGGSPYQRLVKLYTKRIKQPEAAE